MFWCWLNELSMKLESRVRLEFITVQTANLVFEAGLPGSLAQAGHRERCGSIPAPTAIKAAAQENDGKEDDNKGGDVHDRLR